MSYHSPREEAEAEVVIRRSRFVAAVFPVSTRDDAMDTVAVSRRRHPKARHHCWAYLIGSPVSASDAGSSDEGEPSGTAGRPILGVIQGREVGDIAVVVSRYFGGVKLGAGGLARAYANAATAALDKVPVARQIPMEGFELHAGFAQEHMIRAWAAESDAAIESVNYREYVIMRLAVPTEHRDALDALCRAEGIDCRPIAYEGSD